jgi:ankyrin repeat protein
VKDEAGIPTKSGFQLAALERIITSGDLQLYKRLKEGGISIEGHFRCGCAPLTQACLCGRWEMALQLLSHGASVDEGTCASCSKSELTDEFNPVGYTPLHYAAYNNNEKVFKALIEKSNQRYMTRAAKIHPLHLAAMKGCIPIMRLLFDHAEDSQALLEVRDMFRRRQRHPFKDIRGGTPLHYAAKHGEIEAVEFLIKAGADIEARDFYGLTPLQHSITEAISPETLELLIWAGADVNTRDVEGETPLMRASQLYRRGEEFLKILSNHSHNLEARNNRGMAVLSIAIDSHEHRNATMLIELGSETTLTDYFGISPIQYSFITSSRSRKWRLPPPGDEWRCTRRYGNYLNTAVQNGRDRGVPKLLSRAPPHLVYQYVNQHSEISGTPLYAAALRGSIKTMMILIERGAEVNVVGGPLGTPLTGACEMGRAEAVVTLLRQGAKLEAFSPAKSHYGSPEGTRFSAVEAARDHEHVLLLLERYIAKGAASLDEAAPPRQRI